MIDETSRVLISVTDDKEKEMDTDQ